MMAMQIISALLPAIVYRSASGGGGDYSRFTTKLRSNYAKGKLLSGKGSRDVIEGGGRQGDELSEYYHSTQVNSGRMAIS